MLFFASGRLLSTLQKIEIDEPSQNALKVNKDFLRRLRGLGEVNFQDVIPVAAVMGDGLDRLKESVKYLVQDLPRDIDSNSSSKYQNDFAGI